MAYNDQISKEQGAFKISEAFTDHELDIIQTEIGESGIEVIERMLRIQGDAFRKSSYILHSEGRINWTGDQLQFDSDARANDIILRLLQTEDANGAVKPRTIDLKIIGHISTNSEQTFNTIDMANGDLLYLELDRDQVFAAASGSGEVNHLELHNAVGGLSIYTGATVKKVNLSSSSGMPAIEMDSTGFNGSFCIPLAMRVDWTDDIDTYQDIWWIPHGIRWPANVRSTVGAVIVQGFETLPSVFVRNITEFNQAITDLTSTGGIICLQNNITIDSQITVPADVHIFGRSASGAGSNPANIIMATGGQLIMSDRSRLWNVFIAATSLYGTSGTAEDNTLVKVVGQNVSLEKCWFQLNNASGSARCIDFEGSDGRAIQCTFENSFSGNVAFYFSTGGAGNIHRDSSKHGAGTLWTVGTWEQYQTSTDEFHSGGINESDTYKLFGAIPPVGSIIAINQGYYNSTQTALTGVNLGYMKGANLSNGNWKFCDGSALNDSQSNIWIGSGRYLPKLNDDRFLMGKVLNSGTVKGGDNSMAHTHRYDHSHGNTGNSSAKFSTNTTYTQVSVLNTSHTHAPGSLFAYITDWGSGNDSWVLRAVAGVNFTGNRRLTATGQTGSYASSTGLGTQVGGTTGGAVGLAPYFNASDLNKTPYSNTKQLDHYHSTSATGSISTLAASNTNNIPLYLVCWYYIRVK